MVLKFLPYSELIILPLLLIFPLKLSKRHNHWIKKEKSTWESFKPKSQIYSYQKISSLKLMKNKKVQITARPSNHSLILSEAKRANRENLSMLVQGLLLTRDKDSFSQMHSQIWIRYLKQVYFLLKHNNYKRKTQTQ